MVREGTSLVVAMVIGALAAVGMLPSALADTIDYSATDIQPLAKRLGRSSHFMVMDPVAPGDTVQFTLSAALLGSSQGPAPGLPLLVTFFAEDQGGHDPIPVVFSTSGEDTATHSFERHAGNGVEPFTAVVTATAPLIPGGYRFKIQATDDLRFPNGRRIESGGGFFVHFRVRPRTQPMVRIRGGWFQMGDSFGVNEGYVSEQPVHWVYLDAFYMDRTEVTNQQYAAALNWANSRQLITVADGVVYNHNGDTSHPYCATTTISPFSRITWDGTTFGVTPGKADHPMGMVSWWGSVAYANWRSAMQGKPLCYDLSTWKCHFRKNGYRLPTEAEWEKAARGGASGHRFPWSDSDEIQQDRANYISDPFYPYDTSPTRGDHPLWGVGDWPYTSPVGFFDGSLQCKEEFDWSGEATSFQTSDGANGYGLYDMAGNVWERCNDWFDLNYYASSPHFNPRGPGEPGVEGHRVLRGGSWYSNAYTLRCAARAHEPPEYMGGSVGFRLVLDSD